MALQYGLNNATDFASSKLVSFASVLTRTAGQPMDKSQLWYPLDGKTGLERAQEYAASTSAYVGQEIAVIDVNYDTDGTTVLGTSVTFYGIQDAAGTLKELGSKPLGDDASIAVDADGKIHLYGFADADEGLIPFKSADGKLEWKSIASVVAGVSVKGQNGVKVTETEDEESGKAVFTVEADVSEDETNALELKDGKLYVPTVEIPEVDVPEYAIVKDATPSEGSQATYHLTKDGKNVDVAIEIPEQTDYTVTMLSREDEEGDDHSAFKHYIFEQCGEEIGHIDIPRDLVVEEGHVKEVIVTDYPYEGAVVGEKYIELKIANQAEPLYIPANDLVEYISVDNTNTIKLTLDENHVLTADIKISAEEGNSLVAKKDGLYVNAPELPTVEDAEVEKQVVVAVAQTDGAIEITRKQLSYNDLADLPTIPEIPALNYVEDTATVEPTSDAVINVIKNLTVNDHTITEELVAVASQKGLEDLIAVVGKKATDSTAATGMFADIAALGLTVDNKVDKSVANANNGVRFINQEEIDKLTALVLDESGSVGISGTINADNVYGLGSTIVELVTGTGEYVSTPAIGNEGEENYTPAVIVDKLGIEAGAQVNIIEGIALPDAVLTINPETKTATIPAATAISLGVVKSSTADNQISYADGIGTVNAVTTDKLKNGTEEFILNGGNANGAVSA